MRPVGEDNCCAVNKRRYRRPPKQRSRRRGATLHSPPRQQLHLMRGSLIVLAHQPQKVFALRHDWSRNGRVERAVRRCLVYYGPSPTGALVRSIFGRGRVKHWWYWRTAAPGAPGCRCHGSAGGNVILIRACAIGTLPNGPPRFPRRRLGQPSPRLTGVVLALSFKPLTFLGQKPERLRSRGYHAQDLRIRAVRGRVPPVSTGFYGP
jgi:hypothetical protein